MPTVPDKQKLPVAVKERSNFSLDKHIIMTHDFGVMNALECKFMVPGDKFTLKPQFFTYLNPLPCPTFGQITMSTRAFFVPYRIIFKDWKSFISNQKVASGAHSSLQIPLVPWSSVHDFTEGFIGIDSGGSASQFINENGTRKDIRYVAIIRDQNNNLSLFSRFYELTYLGRQMLSVLRGLGWNVPFVMNSASITESEALATDDSDIINSYYIASKPWSVAPIVAYYRAYFDWIVPSRFLNDYVQARRMLDIYFGERASDFKDSSNNRLYGSWWDALLKCFPSCYLAPDYFTDSFVSQFGAESVENSSTIIPNIGTHNGYEYDNVGTNLSANDVGAGADVRTSDGANKMAINQLTIRSLGVLQDMLNRGKIAGTKIQDWLRVTYGLQPGSDALDLSTYLGKHSSDIQIGSVSSNADTYNATSGDGATLGQFAGRGLGGNDKEMTFSYEAKEHGLFIMTCELNVKTSYWQGIHPEFDMLERPDFFLPELDNVNMEAVPQYRLNFSQGRNSGDVIFSNPADINPFSIVGFQPTYSEHKVNFDSLLGDFRVGGLNTGMDSWYLARFFQGEEHLNNVFCRVVQDNTSREYDNIFQNATNSADHFTTKWYIKFDASRPMKSLKERLEFSEDSGSRSVDVDFNGEH